MLQCVNIVKDYFAGGQIVHALQDVSVTFRESEFVSILGPSGCGKTTFLNIIGGLDQYTSGDLIINGKSTKQYTEKDWDTYRNHRIGFVFQSYNLITHQSVFKNVEMSLLLSGVDEATRKKMTEDALKAVGLEDQMYKKPAQLSGGQMQRVAIARALVNDPDILLADEPTGALDSKTSVQVMDILKEVAKDRLVIMVTHNPELAENYSSRIIQLKDGKIISDSNPFETGREEEEKKVLKKPSMSFLTALKLSFSNLMTKKGRTFLTSFAGSIGIIGIGLIMSLSNGVQNYINSVENDTMASYPIELQDNTMNIGVMFEAMNQIVEDTEDIEADDEHIGTQEMIGTILESVSKTDTNNLGAFKEFLEDGDGKEIVDTAKAIEYSYGAQLNIFNPDAIGGMRQVAPNSLLADLGFSSMTEMRNIFMDVSDTGMSENIFQKLPESRALVEDDYQLIDGHWPENANEMVLEINENNQVTDYVLYSLGLMDQDELVANYRKVLNGETDELKMQETLEYTKEEFMDLEFDVLPSSSLYEKVGPVWVDQSDNENYLKEQFDTTGLKAKIVGIIKPADKTVQTQTMGRIFYSADLEKWASDQAKDSAIVKEQEEHPDINVFTGQSFSDTKGFSMDDLTPEQMMALSQMPQEELAGYISTYNENVNATYDSNLSRLGVIEYSEPSSIKIYASSFDDKEKLGNLINDYNDMQEADNHPENILSYTDIIGTMLSGIQQVINMISYVLIGFVSVSLVVSSIMIGIITYISVLERIKEIGILRAIGASKRDIRNVFNAETFLIGLASGLLGVGVTILLDIPASLIIENLTGVAGLAVLPWQGGLILILINLILTMISGLIPASVASRKNPVEALRVD